MKDKIHGQEAEIGCLGENMKTNSGHSDLLQEYIDALQQEQRARVNVLNAIKPEYLMLNLGVTPGVVDLPPEVRAEREAQLNVERIIQAAIPAEEYLFNKLTTHRLVLLGEAHTSTRVEKFFIADFLQKAKEAGVTCVGIEVNQSCQNHVDRFMETGIFAYTDDADDYEKEPEYSGLFNEVCRGDHSTLSELSAFGFMGERNFMFTHLRREYPLIKRARELGLRIRCIDGASLLQTDEYRDSLLEGDLVKTTSLKRQRDMIMYENVRDELLRPGSRMMVLLGALHVMRKMGDHDHLADFLAQDASVDSCNLTIDRDYDTDPDCSVLTKGGESVNTVFFSALNRNNVDTVGFDLTSDLLNVPPTGEFPVDGYIKI